MNPTPTTVHQTQSVAQYHSHAPHRKVHPGSFPTNVVDTRGPLSTPAAAQPPFPQPVDPNPQSRLALFHREHLVPFQSQSAF